MKILILIILFISISSILNSYTQNTWSNTNSTLSSGSKLLNIQPRSMWGQVGTTFNPNPQGYCGEASVQTAGLYYGNYVSQGIVWNAAGTNSQLLLGTSQNGGKAVNALYLTYSEWSSSSGSQKTAYTAWVKSQIDAGYPVIAGFYLKTLSDPDYDHIMPIIGYKITSGDISGFYYNTLMDDVSAYSSTGYVELTIGSQFFATRSQCSSSSNVYCLPSGVAYGISVTGNRYPSDAPAQLFTNPWNNDPDWGPIDGVNAAPISITGTLVVQTTAGANFTCLRFDSTSSLPNNDRYMCSSSYSKKYTFGATGSSYSLAVADMMSNGNYFFRCFNSNVAYACGAMSIGINISSIVIVLTISVFFFLKESIFD